MSNHKNNTKKPKNYLEPATFFNRMILDLIAGQASDELGEMFMLLAKKYSNHRYFVRYTHIRDDLEAIGMMSCCKAWSKFKPLRPEAGVWDGKTVIEYDYKTCYSPLAFFTSCIHNDFVLFLKQEYNQRNILNALNIEAGLEADYGYTEMIKEREEKERSEKEDQDEQEELTVVDDDPFGLNKKED